MIPKKKRMKQYKQYKQHKQQTQQETKEINTLHYTIIVIQVLNICSEEELKMTLKSLKLARAEDLDEETREAHGLPDSGLIAIETRNPELKEKFISLSEGMSNYLRSLGDFEDVTTELK